MNIELTPYDLELVQAIESALGKPSTPNDTVSSALLTTARFLHVVDDDAAPRCAVLSGAEREVLQAVAAMTGGDERTALAQVIEAARLRLQATDRSGN